MHALRANLPRAREAAGVSQADLGAAVGYSGAWVSQIENGDLLPRVDLLAAVAQDLGVTVSALLGEDTTDEAALERALPGWARLDLAQQENVRGIVKGLAHAPILDPTTAAAVARIEAEVEAQDTGRTSGPGTGTPRRRSEDRPRGA